MRARYLTLLTVLLCCSACSAPSLRHKKEINKLLAAQSYSAAIEKIESAKDREYKQRDAVLYYLDSGALLHEAGEYTDQKLKVMISLIDHLVVLIVQLILLIMFE